MKKFAVVAGVAVLLAALAPVAVAGDVSGKWISKMETPRGTFERTFVLKQEGSKLTGKIVTPRGETEIKDGKVNGDEIEFKAEQRMGPEGGTVTAVYKAKVSGDKLTGTIEVGDRGSREWTATKEK